ncbi:MAG: hypothetical protein D6746_06080, partial [Bacteroidetes bacterium]
MTTRFLTLLLTWILAAVVPALAGPRPGAPTSRAAFGTSVAFHGDLLFIGEPQSFREPGTVHVYRRSGAVWTLVTRLRASDADVGDGFGRLLAAAAGRVAVAGPAAVYVFEDGEAGWTEVARLEVEDAAGDRTAAALALDGNRLLVGAPGHDARRGRVYVFLRDPDGVWTASDTLRVDTLEPGDAFGATLALSGDGLLVGAPGRNEGTGGAFAFRRTRTGWEAEALLTAAPAVPGSRAGSAVALDGAYAFVGAPRHEGATGIVFTFYREPDGTWVEQPALRSAAPAERTFFGAALAAGGGTLWVGVPGADDFTGRLEAFLPTPDGWTHDVTLTGPGTRPGDVFGATLAATGDRLAVGATRDDYGEGSVFLFARTGRTWQARTFLYREAEPMPPLTGEPVECAGEPAAGFSCRDVDLLAFIPNAAMDIGRGVRLNDVWGWTDPETGREYALVGHMEGTVFLDVTDPTRPVYLG